MASTITFLCQHCLTPVNGKAISEEPNPLSDIAFAMPDSIFEAIRSKVAKISPETAKAIQKDRFKCITMEDLDQLHNERKGREKRAGKLVLTWRWLYKKMQESGIAADKVIAEQQGNVYEAMHEFWFKKATDGTWIPDLIMDAERTVIGRELRCRKCGRSLPMDTGKAPEFRILLQGNSRAGKTSVIVSTFWWLLEVSASSESGIRYEQARDRDAMSGGMAAKLNEYHRWLKRELDRFSNGHKVEKTPTKQDEPGSVSALVHIGDQSLVLTFLDMPGEFFESPQDGRDLLLKQYTNIYRHVDAIWTCLQFEVLVDKDWSKEKTEILDRSGVEESNLKLDRIEYDDRLRELPRFLTDENIDSKPHAVILTKTDTLENRVPGLKENFIFTREDLLGKYNLQDGIEFGTKNGVNYPMLYEEEFHRIASKVYSFCKKHAVMGKVNILPRLENVSDKCCFFAHSAYGQPALEKGSNSVKAPNPYHVQLPLLWTLAACDKLQIFYEVRVQRGLFGHSVSKEMHLLSEADQACKNHLLKNPRYYTSHIRRGKE